MFNEIIIFHQQLGESPLVEDLGRKMNKHLVITNVCIYSIYYSTFIFQKYRNFDISFTFRLK